MHYNTFLGAPNWLMSHQACWQLHQWPLLQALTLNGTLQCWEADKGSGVGGMQK